MNRLETHLPRIIRTLLTAFLVSFITGCTERSVVPDGSEKPNVIIIITDDMGYGDLSYTGNTNIRTPQIDSLAGGGASFTNFYVSPVCSPTRAELLTGRYHPRSGVYGTSAGGERLDLDETTIAEVFKKAGYSTGIFGKWHNGMQYPYHPNARGFDEFYGFASGHWGDYFSPNLLERNGKLVSGEGYIVDDFTDKALTFIEENKDESFFALLTYNTPHSPMQVPDKWWDQFDEDEIEMRNRDPEREGLTFTRAALAMVKNIDWNVGRVQAKLDELGLEENTILIFMSDNGPNSWRWNDGMKGRKGSVDEGGVRSPFFIQWEGEIEKGRKIDQIASVIDLLPTLADLAEIELDIQKPLDGVSLKPLLVNESDSLKDRFLYSHWNGRVSLRSQNWRYNSDGQLHNMIQDPGQKVDVSEDYPELVQQLADSVAKWESEVLAELETDTDDDRSFPVGHPGFPYTQLPARDGVPHGGIQRSNQYPNDTFFQNWTSLSDSITWDVEVLESGRFEVQVYYTARKEDVGSTIQLSFGNDKISRQITEAHDPPLEGMENDRVERIESYVKDFKPMNLGTIYFETGRGLLTLKALDIPGGQVMDVRLLMFTRVE